MFCSPFNNFLKCLLDDLQAYSEFSTDISQTTEEICIIVDIPFKTKQPSYFSKVVIFSWLYC